MDEQPNTTDLVALTAEIVASYAHNNKVEADVLPGIISAVYGALRGIGEPSSEPTNEPEVEKPSPAQIRKSISDAGLVSFIDGRTYQSLKRHLGTNGMTPVQYRERYGLKPDYPMVAPAYAARRSELAKAIGLGSKGRQPKGAAKPARKAKA